MKKFITCIMLLSAIDNTSFSQEVKNPNEPLNRQEYLKKSRGQMIGACILLGAGIIAIASVSSGNASFNTLGTVVTLGGVSILASIPLFIASGRNKRKARKASAYLNLERISHNPVAVNSMIHYAPAFCIKLSF